MKKIISLALLGACLIACALILVKPNIVFRQAGGVNVKGYAVERVVSDAATWDAEIKTISDTERGAYAQIIEKSQTAQKFLLNLGASKEKLQSSAIKVLPIYKRENGEITDTITGFTATLKYTYSDSDITLVEKLAKESSKLIEDGVSIYPSDPKYYYTKLEDRKLSLIEKASQNARERAEKLTKGSNSKLGKILSASQGIFQITPPLSNETSDWGMYDTSSQQKDVRCVVTIEFSIEK